MELKDINDDKHFELCSLMKDSQTKIDKTSKEELLESYHAARSILHGFILSL